MNVVKITTSGQISIPKELRKNFKSAYFTCEAREGGIFFKNLSAEKDPFEKKYSIKDLKRGIFKSKNPKEKRLAYKIDEILYGA